MSARGCEVHAACSVNFPAGAPTFVWQSGEWSATITDNGTGDITMTFNAASGVDPTEVGWAVQPLNAAAQIMISVDVLTDTTTRLRIWNEGAGPAAAADIPFSAIVYRRVII